MKTIKLKHQQTGRISYQKEKDDFPIEEGETLSKGWNARYTVLSVKPTKEKFSRLAIY